MREIIPNFKLDKSKLQPNTYLLHRYLGIVKYAVTCYALELSNADSSSIFVNDFGEIKEVSVNCIIDKRNPELQMNWRES